MGSSQRTGKSVGVDCANTVLPVSSRRTPGGKRICAVALKRSGSRWKASWSAAKKPGSSSMSLLSRQTCEQRARAMPRLTARAKESGAGEGTGAGKGEAGVGGGGEGGGGGGGADFDWRVGGGEPLGGAVGAAVIHH